MKVPKWLYFVLVIGGTGALTLFLSFLFFYAFEGFVNSDLYIFLLILFPFFISLPVAYKILKRKYSSPIQRRLLHSILISFIGIIMFLSGIAVYFSSFTRDPLEALIALLGFVLMLHGFSLALPGNKDKGALIEDPTLADHLNPLIVEGSAYLPAAGVAILLASILTSLVTFLTVVTAIGSCYSVQTGCISMWMILGVLSAVGVITGIVATSPLLKGKYRRTVPLGLIFLTTSPVIILTAWNYWFLLATPILALCCVSMALTAWSQKNSLTASDWKALAILSASLGVTALVAGSLQYFQNAYTCLGVWVRPYLNNAEFLFSLGVSGVTLALLSIDSALGSRVKPTGSLQNKPKKAEKSLFFYLLIIMLTVSLAASTVFAGALIGPFFTQCRGFCYTQVDQLNIVQAIPIPSSNRVNFTLSNSGTSVVTITEIQVLGPGTNNSTYASPFSALTICAGTSNTLLLVATFPGVTFVKGTTYSFKLVSSNGDTFPYSATA